MKKRNKPAGKIRVVLVDDHAGMREALRRVIDSTSDLTVVAEAQDGRTAVDVLQRVNADIVLMDGSMPEMNGMETTYLLRQIHPSVKVIGLTLYEEATYLEEMIAAGASGYVLKTGQTEKLIEAMHTVAAGGTYFDEAISRPSTATRPGKAETQQLSADELSVVKRVADGQTDTEIAADLELTIPIVERHRTAAMEKLNVCSRAELTRLAVARGW
jgi:DNA-binding NarL/FixJ family response regulator